MTKPLVGLSLMVEEDYLRAAYPLFEAGRVEVLEWSFDMGWGPVPIPGWADELLGHFSEAGRLLGHGVTYSALSAQWTERQSQWLDLLAEECQLRHYSHISEHFGFSTAGSFHDSAPLPVPRDAVSLHIGHDRLSRLAAVTDVPIGLENLAFAFGRADVQAQGAFLDELLQPVDGFLLLDLHNIYCQMCNFGLSASDLLDSYPLARVRELHVSGGSWSTSQYDASAAPVRRDTHDDAVPDEVFALVALALRRCPQVRTVIMERLGNTMDGHSDRELFAADFYRLHEVVASSVSATVA